MVCLQKHLLLLLHSFSEVKLQNSLKVLQTTYPSTAPNSFKLQPNHLELQTTYPLLPPKYLELQTTQPQVTTNSNPSEHSLYKTWLRTFLNTIWNIYFSYFKSTLQVESQLLLTWFLLTLVYPTIRLLTSSTLQWKQAERNLQVGDVGVLKYDKTLGSDSWIIGVQRFAVMLPVEEQDAWVKPDSVSKPVEVESIPQQASEMTLN